MSCKPIVRKGAVLKRIKFPHTRWKLSIEFIFAKVKLDWLKNERHGICRDFPISNFAVWGLDLTKNWSLNRHT